MDKDSNLKRQSFSLSPDALARQRAQREAEKEREKEALEAEKTRALESIQTIFDNPDFFVIYGKLTDLEKFLGKEYVVFSKEAKDGINHYSVEYLRNLFKRAQEYAQSIIDSPQSKNFSPTESWISMLKDHYRKQGVTNQKIYKESQLGFGLRDCVVECILNFLKDRDDSVKIFKPETSN